MNWFVVILNLVVVYIALGCVASMRASYTSGKDTLNEKEIIILTKIIFMWGWKYKVLAKTLKR